MSKKKLQEKVQELAELRQMAAELADENSTNAPETPGIALTIGESRISTADTKIARAGTLRSDT